MVLSRLKAGWPLSHKFRWLNGGRLSIGIDTSQVFSHNANSTLIVDEGPLGLCVLEELSNFKVGIVIQWIELKDVSEKFECFSLVIGVSGLTSLDLSQKSDGFVAILVAIAGKNSVQMCLCSLKVSHVE